MPGGGTKVKGAGGRERSRHHGQKKPIIRGGSVVGSKLHWGTILEMGRDKNKPGKKCIDHV